MTERVECVVVGAGVVGLAVARRLAMAGREVVVLEAAETIGTGTSSRNSEVIHAGIYYATDSLKARLCVAGNEALYAYCAARAIAHARVGKIIVATNDDEVAILHRLRDQGLTNRVPGLEIIDGAATRALEPRIISAGALLSPSSGIIDSHGLMLSLQGDAEAHGAAFAFNTPLVGGKAGAEGIRIEAGGAAPMALDCAVLVNAAGLGAQAVAAAIDGIPAATIPRRHLAKGSYFTLSGKAPFSRLIYPVPGPASLGIHFTVDLGGRPRFGPDAEWVDDIDYDVDPRRAEAFYAAIRRYWPDLADGALHPAYAGVRPKVQAPGEPPADFVIQGAAVHGVPGLVNLFGIESPGLTASMAIADHVAAML